MSRSFEKQDQVRTRYWVLGVPKHTLGTVVMVCKDTVHVVFSGYGAAILDPNEIELVPTVKHFQPEQLELFKRDEKVVATVEGERVMVTPFLGTTELPEWQVVTTPRALKMAYITTTSFEDFLRKVFSNEQV